MGSNVKSLRSLFVALLILVVAHAVFAANRFNVMTYSDNIGVANLDSFYIGLDEFGVSQFYTSWPDSVCKYRDSLGLDFGVWASNWGGAADTTHTVRISDAWPWTLYWFANLGIHVRMAGENDYPEHGYQKNTAYPGYVGQEGNCDILRRTVLKAEIETDGNDTVSTAGWLHPPFSKAVFQRIPVNYMPIDQPVPVTARFNMRLLDDTGPVNTVVARISVWSHSLTDWPADFDCSDSTGNPYAVKILNDTLAIVGLTDTIRVLDSAYHKVYYKSCVTEDGPALSSSPVWLYDLCYVDGGGDTICTIPYCTEREITVGDFSDTSSYVSFSMPTYVRAYWASHAYRVYWTNQRTIYLDSLYVQNEVGARFVAMVDDSLPRLVDSVQQYYDDHPYQKSVDAWYIVDEPKGPEFCMVEKLNEVMAQLGSGYPEYQTTTLGAYNGPSNSYAGRYFDSYMHYNPDPGFYLYDHYSNACWLTTSSESPTDTTSFQFLLDNSFIPSLERARERSVNMQPNAEFWVTLPTFAAYTRGDSTGPDEWEWHKVNRMHTKAELQARVALSLAYGAKGIGYWEYMGRDGEEYNTPGCDPDLRAGEPDLRALLAARDSCSTRGDACSTVVDECPPYVFKGLMDIDENNRAVPFADSMWYHVRDINHYLDSMAYLFNNWVWQSAGRENEIGDLTASFIDSLKTNRSNYTPFVEASFQSYNNQTYCLLVNRRVDDGTGGLVDTQTVTLFMSGEGAYQLWDVYENSCDTLWDSAGVLTYKYTFEPGAFVVLRRATIKHYWQGTVGSSWPGRVWPQFSTIHVVGDITIPSGDSLVILTDRVGILANIDSTHGGLDANKIEFIANGGMLKIDGNDSNVIAMDPGAKTSQGWYGIRTTNGGKVNIDHAAVRNAYRGLWINTGGLNTVENTAFELCYDAAIVVQADMLEASDCDFAGSNGYGVAFLKGAVVEESRLYRCDFDSVLYPIDIDTCSPEIESCDFHLYKNWSQPAADIVGAGTPVFSNCEFFDFGTGIQIFRHSDVEVTGCRFDSDSSTSTGHPFMDYGIAAPASGTIYGTPSCKVRGCCFERIDCDAVNRCPSNFTFDLGHVIREKPTLVIDSGLSTFYFYSDAYGGGDTTYPEHAFMNNPGTSQHAVANLWDDDAPGGWISSGVDTSYPVSFLYAVCAEAGGGSKAAPQQCTSLVPPQSELIQNYPNPFNLATIIGFHLAQPGRVRLKIMNVLGQTVTTLIDQDLSAGNHSVEWDGRNRFGDLVSSGVYYYRLEAEGRCLSKKMVLIK